MARVHTHYDNLKVARNAPPELIRAAYRTLSQKYHPDRNPGDSQAARIMTLINDSYKVLSDPIKRQEHDIWIAEQERTPPVNEESATSRSPEFSDSRAAKPPASDSFAQKLVRTIRKRTSTWLPGDWIVLGVLSVFAIAMWFNSSSEPSAVRVPAVASKPYVADPPPQTLQYVRPRMAPNGSPWPTLASYVSGYKKLHTDGRSTVTVDNSGNESDVFVKLVFLDSAQAYPVRVFFIPAFGSFTIKGVRAGNYGVRYRDLSTGGISRTEPFSLKENPVQYSNITMTLYKVPRGNMQTYAISDAEF
jgi:hypothetical protein